MKRWLFIWLSVSGLLFVADRVFKNIFLTQPLERSWVFDFLSFHFVKNPGIAFGIQIPPALITVLVTLILIIFTYLALRVFQSSNLSRRFELAGYITIIIGALSNLIDRLRYGFVIDYIDVSFFTVFNLADAMITVGVLVILFDSFFKNKLDKKDSLS